MEFLFLLFVVMPMAVFGPIAIVGGILSLDAPVMFLGVGMTLLSWIILTGAMERRGVM